MQGYCIRWSSLIALSRLRSSDVDIESNVARELDTRYPNDIRS